MVRPVCNPPRSARQVGVSLIETMVGILIGLIVIAVIYNILSVADGYRRATVGASDAQITGLLTQFMAGRDAGNGGAGIMMSTSTWNGTAAVPSDLANCLKNEAGAPLTSATPDVITTLDYAVRPIPVIIFENYHGGPSDSFVSLSAGAAHVIWPVDIMAPFPVAAGDPITVQSPNGFTVPLPTAAAPYWGIAMANDLSGRCKALKLTNAVPDPTVPATGKVTLTQDPTAATGVSYAAGDPPRLLNLGPQGLATRIQYRIGVPADPIAERDVLLTTDLLTTNAFVPVPVAHNVVLMKAQYGVDTNGDGIIDCWTPADASTCGDFSPGEVVKFTLAQLNRILAVRIGVVVRSDEPDLRILTDPFNTELQAEARALKSGTRPPVVLFNCSANTSAACQNRVVVPAGLGAAPNYSPCVPAVICDYWRYRTYESIIPLRNAIYAATIP